MNAYMEITSIDVTPEMRADEDWLRIGMSTGIGSEYTVAVRQSGELVGEMMMYEFIVYEVPNGGSYEGLTAWSRATHKGLRIRGENYIECMKLAYWNALERAVEDVRKETHAS